MNFQLRTFKLFVILQLLYMTNVQAQTWRTLGPDDAFSMPKGEYATMALSSKDVPYVALKDQITGKASVVKYENNLWQSVGTLGFSTGAVYYTSIALSNNNTPYIVYADAAIGNKAVVQTFSAGNWTTLGSTGISKAAAGFTNLAIAPNGEVYICYIDGGNADKITVKKYDGSTWSTVGTEGFSNGAVQSPKVSVDKNGAPYVIYVDELENFKAVVKKFDGSSWNYVGNTSVSSNIATSVDITFNNNNQPYIVYKDGIDYKLYTKLFNGSSWDQLGTGQTGGTSTNNLVIKVAPSGTVYIFNSDQSSGWSLLYKYSNTTWSFETSFGGTTSGTSFGDLEIDSKGFLWVEVSQGGTAVTVKNNINGSFTEISVKGFASSSSPYTPRIVINPITGNPYLYYYSSNIMSFSNGSWSNALPNPGGPLAAFTISPAGIPFAVITTGSAYQAKRYINGTWVNYGDTFYKSNVNDIRINSNGEVFVICNFAIVKYSAGFWIDITNDTSFTYRASCFNSVGDLLVVRYSSGSIYSFQKYSSGIWTSFAENLTTSSENYPSICTDFAGNVYFINYSPSGKTISIYKSSGSSWTTLPGFTNTTVYDAKIMCDASNNLYLSYSGPTINLKKYNNSIWNTVGNNTINTTQAISGQVELGLNDNIFAIYTTNDGMYGKVYGSYSTLPVKLLNYSASKNYSSVDINWITSSELNNSYYLIERATDQKYFKEIAVIYSKGNTSSDTQYSFADLSPSNGINYYRLSQVDKDGNKNILGIKPVYFSLNRKLGIVYPNPISSSIFFVRPDTNREKYQIKIINVIGNIVFNKTLKTEEGTLTVDLGKRLASGMYIIFVEGQLSIPVLVE